MKKQTKQHRTLKTARAGANLENQIRGAKLVYAGTIDMTPKWADIILIHAVAAANGNASAQDELIRCAKLADERNELVKDLKKIVK